MLGIESQNLLNDVRSSNGNGIHGTGNGDLFRGGKSGAFCERAEAFSRFVNEEVQEQEGWGERCRVVGLDGRCEAPFIHHER